MYSTLILWIFLLLSTAVADPPTDKEIETLREGQVVRFSMGGEVASAIFLRHIDSLPHGSKGVKIVQIRRNLPQGRSIPRACLPLNKYFEMHEIDRIAMLVPEFIDLKVRYIPQNTICMHHEEVILNDHGMRKMKEDISIFLVTTAAHADMGPRRHAVEGINSPQKGEIIWVDSEIMYGRRWQKKLEHQVHFAIVLGIADSQHGSRQLKIAQIVMDLPISATVPPSYKADFNQFFQTTWWRPKYPSPLIGPEILLDGDIDLRPYRIPSKYIRIPETKVILDLEGIQRLEAGMRGSLITVN